MPKPNKKRLEAKISDKNLSLQTISADRIKAGTILLGRINLDDLARELGLDDPIKNIQKTSPRKTTED